MDKGSVEISLTSHSWQKSQPEKERNFGVSLGIAYSSYARRAYGNIREPSSWRAQRLHHELEFTREV